MDGAAEEVNVSMTLGEAQAFARYREEQGGVSVRPKNKGDRHMMICGILGQGYHIVRVKANGTFYYREADSPVYRRLTDRELSNMVRDAYLGNGWTVDAKEVKEASDTVKMLTREEVEDLNNGLWYITDTSYWDTNKGELTRDPEGHCFRKLFDTKYEDKHVVKIPTFTKEQDQKMWDTYKEVLEQLNSGEFEERYEFIRTWADGSHDVYLDIMRSVAYCFVKKKPLGSYILVGLRRNGKSSFVGLLHTIFGRENTSGVRLSQLGDPHYVNKIRYTMLNAPDEEDEKAIDAQATFKIIADHGLLSLSVMRSNEPVEVKCDFMCFYPMNHIPEWRGTGAAACTDRSLVIPFYADLSRFDKKNYNFAKETFTADFMCDFMGCVFAYANYYSRHELEYSKTMVDEKGALEEEVDSALIYRKEFEKYFDGFESLRLLYEDYVNWCKTRDSRISTKKEFKFVFREYNNSRSTTMVNGRAINGYRIPQMNHHLLHSGIRFKETGSLEWLHERSASIVERLETYYSVKGGE